jgi:hypothetical protein
LRSVAQAFRRVGKAAVAIKKGKVAMNKVITNQPLSAGSYAIIALVGLVFALAFTVFYVHWVPELISGGVQNQVFYLLLIPWALSSAAFLFGAMRSYAQFTHKNVGNLLELGGPVVLFCIVMVGGFKLIPPQPETFDLAVRAHAKDSPLFTSGHITLDIPGLPQRPIGPDGEANFKGLPPSLKETQIRVLPQIEGYEEKWVTKKIDGGVIDVYLDRLHPVTVLFGSIVPPPPAHSSIKITVDGQDGETSPDELGRFKMNVNGSTGIRIRLKVYRANEIVYDDYQILPGPVTVPIGER